MSPPGTGVYRTAGLGANTTAWRPVHVPTWRRLLRRPYRRTGQMPRCATAASSLSGRLARAVSTTSSVPRTDGRPRCRPSPTRRNLRASRHRTRLPTSPRGQRPRGRLRSPSRPRPPRPSRRRTPNLHRGNIESESAPIYERMMSDWLMDSTTRESRDRVWATAADADWAAAAKAVEHKPERHTESGLPIRERGARLVPGRVRGESEAGETMGRDPAGVRDTLSRALAGVRTGRAENAAAHRRIEGDG